MYKRWQPTGKKRDVRYVLKLLKRAPTWQLVIILLLVGFIAATFLRINNLGLIKRRAAVEAADKAGDRVKTKAALVDLQKYVSAHMNTSLGKGVSLPTIYTQDYNKALKKVAGGHNQNSDVYQQAAISCRQKFQGGVASFRNDYVTCVSNAVSQLPTVQKRSASLPDPDAYRYNFASPVFSFDVAGLSVVIFIFLTAVIVVRLLAVQALKMVLRRRAKVY